MTAEQLTTITKLLDVGEIESVCPIKPRYTNSGNTRFRPQLVQIYIDGHRHEVDVFADGRSRIYDAAGIELSFTFVENMFATAAVKRAAA